MQLPTDRRGREGGQIVVLFALSLVVIIALGGLLFSGAQTLVLRRQIQNAGDAAALAGANLVNQNGCAAMLGTDTTGVTKAARDAVVANIPGFDRTAVIVSCPSGYSDSAVKVDLSATTPSFFGSFGLNPKSTSVAVNGGIEGGEFSVVLLDESNPLWGIGGNRPGCSSFTVNGGITVTYGGSIMVDSACALADSNNGAVKAANSAFSLVLSSGSSMQIVGQASAGTAAHISPPPIENVHPALKDPLGTKVPPCHNPDPPASDPTPCLGSSSTLPAKDTKTTGSGQCKSPNNDPCVLYPGTYKGGLLAANGSGSPSTLLLRPGVYYIEGGGVQLKSGSGRMLAIPSATGLCGGQTCTDAKARARYATNLTDTNLALNWQADCPPPTATTTCGVMIYNAKDDNKSGWTTTGQSDQITNGSQGVLLLRGYNPANDPTNGTLFDSYKNLVVWQSRDPRPTKTITQPVIAMVGGACVTLSGTVYAAGAEVDFGGSSCGGGGGGDAVTTLQFICWDLTLGGSNNFDFNYQRNSFATPTFYGLVQ